VHGGCRGLDRAQVRNHVASLASIENLFGLRRLGYAGIPGLRVFGLGVYDGYAG
jgi:hypothetical protein